jgi:hypothetical protein
MALAAVALGGRRRHGRRTSELSAGPICPSPMPPICTQNITVMMRPPLTGQSAVAVVFSRSALSVSQSPSSSCLASTYLRVDQQIMTLGVQTISSLLTLISSFRTSFLPNNGDSCVLRCNSETHTPRTNPNPSSPQPCGQRVGSNQWMRLVLVLSGREGWYGDTYTP